MMSDPTKKLEFGRDTGEFLRSLGLSDRDGESAQKNSGIHIVSLNSNNDGGRVKLKILVENQSGSESLEFILLGEFVEELELSIGDIDGDTMSEIERLSLSSEAFFSACASLSFNEGSRKALERKLLAKGFSRDAARDAIRIVDKRGLIDESELALSRMRVFLAKRWGKGRIMAKLYDEGFEGSAIGVVNDALEEIDFPLACAEVIERKYGEIPDERREREKIYASLSRLGYSSAEIRAAVRMLSEK